MVYLRAATVHCEIVGIEAYPITRRAKISRGNELSDECKASSI